MGFWRLIATRCSETVTSLTRNTPPMFFSPRCRSLQISGSRLQRWSQWPFGLEWDGQSRSRWWRGTVARKNWFERPVLTPKGHYKWITIIEGLWCLKPKVQKQLLYIYNHNIYISFTVHNMLRSVTSPRGFFGDASLDGFRASWNLKRCFFFATGKLLEAEGFEAKHVPSGKLADLTVCYWTWS